MYMSSLGVITQISPVVVAGAPPMRKRPSVPVTASWNQIGSPWASITAAMTIASATGLPS